VILPEYDHYSVTGPEQWPLSQAVREACEGCGRRRLCVRGEGWCVMAGSSWCNLYSIPDAWPSLGCLHCAMMSNYWPLDCRSRLTLVANGVKQLTVEKPPYRERVSQVRLTLPLFSIDDLWLIGCWNGKVGLPLPPWGLMTTECLGYHLHFWPMKHWPDASKLCCSR